MSETETQGVPRRLILLVVAGALIPFVAVGFTLYTTLIRDDDPTFEVVRDYLHMPQVIPERLEQAGEELRRVDITRGNIEVYDLDGQRYSINPDGSMLRRGGSVPVPPQSFTVNEVDFGKLPAILAAVNERTSAEPTRAKLEYVGDELLWTIVYWAESGGSNQLYYTLAGDLRQGSNAG